MDARLFIDLGIALIGGAAVGWLTNAIAVSMLFKKFLGRWGGVIEEQYAAFIENMADLVEADLVNPETLAPEFGSPAFTRALQGWIEDILRKDLPANSGSVRLEAVPDIEKSLANLIALLREAEPAVRDEAYRLLSTRRIDRFLSEEQYRYMLDWATAALGRAGFFEEEIKQGIHGFLSRHGLHELVSEEALARFTDNLGAILGKGDFSRFDRDVDTAYEALLAAVDLDELIRGLETALGQMRFGDFALLLKERETLSRELIRRFIAFSASQEGQGLLLEIMKTLLQDAKAIPLKLDEVLSPEVKTGILKFIAERLPPLIDRIADFIRETEAEIEVIINDTIDEELAASPLGNMFMFFKDLFIQNSARTFHIMDKLVAAVHRYGDKAGEKLAEELLGYIETHSIGAMLGKLEAQKVITPESMVSLITKRLTDQADKDSQVLEGFLRRRIQSCGTVNLGMLKTGLLKRLLAGIKQSYLYTGTCKDDIRAGMNRAIPRFAKKPLGEGISPEAIPLHIEETVLRRTLVNLWPSLKGWNIGRLVPGKAFKTFPLNWEALWHKHKHRRLTRIYQGLQKDAVYERLSEGIQKVLNQHLDRVLTGNVAALVNAELQKSSPAEINHMVQDFMGSELKPINTLGAILGALAGVFSVWISFCLGVPRDFSWGLFLAYGGVFSLVGIGTNWLAIKMLFKPYGPRKTLPNCSPFVGVVAARKPEFAKNIAQFVQHRTLNEGALQSYCNRHRRDIQEKADAWVSAEDYAVIRRILADPSLQETLPDRIIASLKTYIPLHHEAMANAAVTTIEAWVHAGNLKGSLPRFLRERIMSALEDPDVARGLHRFLSKALAGKPLDRGVVLLFPLADQYLKGLLETCASDLSAQSLRSLLSRSEKSNARFSEGIAKTSLEDLAGPELVRDIGTALVKPVEDLLSAGLEVLLHTLQQEALNPDTALKEVFNGILVEQLTRHSTLLITMITREITAQKAAIKHSIKAEMTGLAALGRGQVDPIVDRLIDKELPLFLHQKQGRILAIAGTLLENKLSSLGFTEESLDTRRIKQALAAVVDSPHTQRLIRHGLTIMVTRYARMPLESLLTLINIKTLPDLLVVGEPLLDAAIRQVKPRLAGPEAVAAVANLVHTVMLGTAKDAGYDELLHGIDPEQVLRLLITRAKQDRTFGAWLSSFLLTMLETLGATPGWYHPQLLRQDLAVFLQTADWEALDGVLTPVLRTVMGQVNTVLTPATKDAFCKTYLIPAALSAGERHFSALIAALDIQRVVEREVNVMHPRQVEVLFYRFADKYFRKITLYGWIGVFGGMVSYMISCLLSLLFQ
ncbi:MAG: DUF445 domain-containing protein [Treponema sp.]|nr:DUF445 domain-containing protein [Treponema sp.]